MKKLLSLIFIITGCASVQTKEKCTPIMLVENQRCYQTCLVYTGLSAESAKKGVNRNFLSCLDQVCGGGWVCLSNIETKTQKY